MCMSPNSVSVESKNGPEYVDVNRSDLSTLEIFEEHRPQLLGIAYRMTGSVADAEDAVQETFIRWQAARGHGIGAPKAFLITIVSRLCLSHMQSARKRREEYVGQWLPEPLITSRYTDAFAKLEKYDSLSVAFLLLLERLTPAERAVFVLREVFDLAYPQVATAIGKSEVNCRQIFRRARKYIVDNRPRFEASIEQRDNLLREFLQATTSGNVELLVALLAEDVAFYSDGGGKAVAIPNVVIGRNKIVRLIFGALKKFVPTDVTRHIVEANAQLAIASYFRGAPRSLLSLDIDRNRVKNIYIVTNPDKLRSLERVHREAQS
jgi:RNA polymerase sigma-70 factor, ECF subfamily